VGTGTSLGRAAKCPLTHGRIEGKPEKEIDKRWDLSRSQPVKSGLGCPLLWLVWSVRITCPSWPIPQIPPTTKDELLQSPPIPHSHPFVRLFPSPVDDIMFNDDIIYPPSTKDYMPQPLYVCQPYSLQIIQLVECSPPPPQQKYTPSRISSSSYSDSVSDSSAYDSSSSSLSAGSSYCSSAEDSHSSAAPGRLSFDSRDPSVDDTYRTRQRRVSLWRDAVYSKNVANSGSSVALVGRSSSFSDPFASSRPQSICICIELKMQLVPLLLPKSENVPMVVIWPTAIRWW